MPASEAPEKEYIKYLTSVNTADLTFGRYYETDDLGYDTTLVKSPILEDYKFPEDSETPEAVNTFTGGTAPSTITSGDMTSNFNIVQGYLKSSNFLTGVNGWKFDAVGNLEANSGTFRGSLYATTGNIGDWVISSTGLYYDGTGTPSIRTAATVGSGSDGVLIDKDGIKVYDSVLGVVVNLPSDGSAPSFASGTIENTTFEINTNAVLRTSDTVGDGTASSAGVLINNSGFYACEASQLLADANVRIDRFGNAFFRGTIDSSTLNSTNINGGVITGSSITGATITGGLLRTAASGRRIEIDSTGIVLKSGTIPNTYNNVLYNGGLYGTGVVAYINNDLYKVPFYIKDEQTVADFHFYNRSDVPTGAAEIGDVCVVGAKLMICITSGTPGVWQEVGTQTGSRSPSASSSSSPSRSPSASPSISPSISPSSS